MVLECCGESTRMIETGLGSYGVWREIDEGDIQCFKTRGEKDLIEAKKKFDQIAHDEEVARKMQDEWEAEEERKRLTEEEATKTALSNEYDFI
ncbi:hypothetical protein Tco_0087670 [Tanacetum coccineum]